MSDWPPMPVMYGNPGPFSTIGGCSIGDALPGTTLIAAGAWPAANRALYFPFYVDQPVTAHKIGFVVAVQAGNYDVGIYDEGSVRLVSVGSTTVPAAGLASADIANTLLTPGTYFMAMVVSTITTLTVSRIQAGSSPAALTTLGVQQQDLGATTLPATATFADMATMFCPVMSVATKPTL